MGLFFIVVDFKDFKYYVAKGQCLVEFGMREDFNPTAVFVSFMPAWFKLVVFVRETPTERKDQSPILRSIRKQRPHEMVWSSDSAVDNALVWIVFRLCPWLHVGERLARQQRWIPDWKFAVLHHIWIERDLKMRPILILIHYFSSNMNNNSILLNYYVS